MMFSRTLGNLLLAVFALWFIIASIRRLNDMGKSPWWAATLLIVYLNVLTIGVLLFSPGEDAGGQARP